MAKNIKTQIFCFDDHRGFTEDIRKRFADLSRYIVYSFPTQEELLLSLEKVKETDACKITILGAHETKEQFELIDEMTISIKQIDHRIGIIVLGPPDKLEEIMKSVKFNVDAYIPKNANSILRIHNIVKKLISENNIAKFRKKRNVSIYVLISFLILSAIFVLFVYFRFPQYF